MSNWGFITFRGPGFAAAFDLALGITLGLGFAAALDLAPLGIAGAGRAS